ncbi:MAG: DUF1772 domain-containing protein [Parafilimonas sp.]
MFTTQNTLLFLSGILSALIMGLLYGYACSVNPGLNKLNDSEYLKAMQSINKEIQNPYFFLSFMGSLIILPVTTWYSKTHTSPACFYFMLIATGVYIIVVIGVTALGNIPLNNGLDKFDISNASADQISAQRKLFESSWNNFHLVRTIASIITTSCSVIAIIKSD